MSRRVKAWAKAKRESLLMALGERCAACGATEDLTFDCVRPAGHKHHAWSTDKRITFYCRQAALRNLQVLCADCNSVKGDFPPQVWSVAVAVARRAVLEAASNSSHGRGIASIQAATREEIRNALRAFTP